MTLREIIKSAGGSLKDWTVMSDNTDPFRIDTPANHRDAQWLAGQWSLIKSHTGKARVHARALHYDLVGKDGLDPAVKPNGAVYINTEQDWEWTQRTIGFARWLGYIPFHEIVDNRNDAPDNFTVATVLPALQVFSNTQNLDTALSAPKLFVASTEDPVRQQDYRLVVIGEKSSLADVVSPICRRFEAELVLPTGELSTTLLYGIAQRANYDGRPCKVFYLSDFDPTGHHMPIEVSRKLQGMVAEFFPDLDIEVRVSGLTGDQVRGLGLPSTPMKDGESRADKWRERYGCEQTELDALRARDLARILTESMAPFFDETLEARVGEAYSAAKDETRANVRKVEDKFVGTPDHAEALRLIDAANAAIKAARDFIVPIYARLAEEVEIVEPDVPFAECEGIGTPPLFSSLDSFESATEMLLEEKL